VDRILLPKRFDQIAVEMNDYYGKQFTNGRTEELTQIEKDGISVRVKRELKTNYYDRERDIVVLTEGQVYAAGQLVEYYRLNSREITGSLSSRQAILQTTLNSKTLLPFSSGDPGFVRQKDREANPVIPITGHTTNTRAISRHLR
jgi:heterodisulfide reductase subunit A-like polyferredoxin